MNQIKTYVVNGFMDAGKTSYIKECIFGGYFHKHGSTLILCFEDGEEEYDPERLREYRSNVVMYDGTTPVKDFCEAAIVRYQPDRIYVEMNVMTEDLRASFPEQMEIVFTITQIDGRTLPVYFNNMRQLFQNMLSDSQMAVFHGCETKEELADYAVPFRVINRRCDYLWQSPMGYSQKAFGRMLPYEIGSAALTISDADYPVFHLDVQEHPKNYEGKHISCCLMVKEVTDPEAGVCRAGRDVMTCCIRDIQFLGFSCRFDPTDPKTIPRKGDWLNLTAKAVLEEDRHHIPQIVFQVEESEAARIPKEQIIGLRLPNRS